MTIPRCSTTALLLLLSVAACSTTPRTGAKAPPVATVDFTLPKPSGETVTLSALKGRVVLVDMWATWCDPCKESFPFYSRLQDEYGEQGFRVLAVSVDTERAAVAEFLEANPVSFTVLHDPEGTVPQKMAIETMPTAFLVGKDGKVAYMHAGFVPEDEAEIEAKVKAALGAP